MVKPRALLMSTQSKLLQRTCLAAVALLCTPAFAYTRPAQCDVRIAGFKSYRGACDVQSEANGSFRLSRPGKEFLTPTPAASYDEQDSILVKVVASGTAVLFGIGGAHQTGTYLATLYRQGACWVSHTPADTINGDARICAK